MVIREFCHNLICTSWKAFQAIWPRVTVRFCVPHIDIMDVLATSGLLAGTFRNGISGTPPPNCASVLTTPLKLSIQLKGLSRMDFQLILQNHLATLLATPSYHG